jgi:hypothetical protein
LRVALVICTALLMVPSSARADTIGAPYREAVFERGATEMATCLVTLLELLEPDLHTFVVPTEDGKVVWAAPANDVEASFWAMLAQDQGDRTSLVKLVSRDASETQLSDVWQMLETCKKQR